MADYLVDVLVWIPVINWFNDKQHDWKKWQNDYFKTQDADLFDFVESVNDCFTFDNDGSSFY